MADQRQLLDNLKAAIKRYNALMSQGWNDVVKATNDFVGAGGIYDASFPPELLRDIDQGALNSAWVYSRLEDKHRYKGTSGKIGKALGYDYPRHNPVETEGFVEIAESFVNGNISWVREKIGNNVKLFNAVLTQLERYYPDSVESFRRLMTEENNNPRHNPRSIGPRWRREIGRLVSEARRQGLEGVNEITDFVKDKLPQEAFDTWEGAFSEIENIVQDIVMGN